jgi:hypothetical protein
MPISASGTSQPAWPPSPLPKIRTGTARAAERQIGPDSALASLRRRRGARACVRPPVGVCSRSSAARRRRARRSTPGTHERRVCAGVSLLLRRARPALLAADAAEAVVAELELELRVRDEVLPTNGRCEAGVRSTASDHDTATPRTPPRPRSAARTAAARIPARTPGSRGRSPARTATPRATSC